MLRYIEGCDEHKIPLVEGRCPVCRDKNGETFILDMQSKCLLDASNFFCSTCGEMLYVADGLRDEEMDNAVLGFMKDHAKRHGTMTLQLRQRIV
jgi:hypothetical protein